MPKKQNATATKDRNGKPLVAGDYVAVPFQIKEVISDKAIILHDGSLDREYMMVGSGQVLRCNPGDRISVAKYWR